MNIATVLHRTAMEFYDLADIYKAKGESQFFEDYKNRAWLLEQEAALKMLSEPEDFTFKYLVIQSAGQLGYEMEQYEAAKQILKLGLMGNPAELERYQMTEILEQISDKMSKSEVVSEKHDKTIIGTLIAANMENGSIDIRERESKKTQSIPVPIDMLRTVIRFYLGEWVKLQLDKNETGKWELKHIHKLSL